MCGPPDFAALETCLVRLAELSAAALGTLAACRTAQLRHDLTPERGNPPEKAMRAGPARLAAEGPNGHADT